MTTRREVLTGAGAGIAVSSFSGSYEAIAANAVSPELPDLSFLTREPLINADRARFFMQKEGLDALVVANPANVYYLSNHWPQLDRMGWQHSGMAIFARDPQRPPATLMHAFAYYYVHSPEDDFRDRSVYLYSNPVEGKSDPETGEPPAAPTRQKTVRDAAPVMGLDERRNRMLMRTEPVAPDLSWALARALRDLGLQGTVLGIDDPGIARLLIERGLGATTRPAENTIRRIRMAKSAAEIRLMRMAAQTNVDAAVAAALATRELGSTSAFRAKFAAEAGARGSKSVFAQVNGVSSELVDEPLKEGMAFAFDCVSQCGHYHGDFARTVFVGEPHPHMQKVVRGIATAWSDIREQLRPGMRFADIPKIGRASLAKQGLELNVSFTPHSVGLFHTDHPFPNLLEEFRAEDLLLEENMVLSVDCPPLDAGLGGTAHLEDLMLIKADGAEAIHSVPPGVFVV